MMAGKGRMVAGKRWEPPAGPPPSARKAIAPRPRRSRKTCAPAAVVLVHLRVEELTRRKPSRRSAAVREAADRTGGLVGPRKACVPAAVALVRLRVEGPKSS